MAFQDAAFQIGMMMATTGAYNKNEFNFDLVSRLCERGDTLSLEAAEEIRRLRIATTPTEQPPVVKQKRVRA